MNKVVFVELESLTNTVSGSVHPLGIWDASINMVTVRKVANQRPQYVCILSNQDGLEKGTIVKRDLEFMMEYFLRSTKTLLKERYSLNPVIEYSYCPYVSSYFKLPNIGMLERFLTRYTTNIAHSDCCYIGKDDTTANNFGCAFIEA